MNAQSPNDETEAQAAAAEATDLPLISAEDWAERKRLAKPGMLKRYIALTAVLAVAGIFLVIIGINNDWYLLGFIPLFSVWGYFFYRLNKPLSVRFNLLCPLCGVALFYKGSLLYGFNAGNVEQDGKCPKCKQKIVENDVRPVNLKKLFAGSFASSIIILLPVVWFGEPLVSFFKFQTQSLPAYVNRDLLLFVSAIVSGMVFTVGTVLILRLKPVDRWIRK